MDTRCKECGATSNLEYNAGVCYLCGHDNKEEKTKKCKHDWIDMKDGTTDQICTKCGLKQKQAVMIGVDMGNPVGLFSALPIAREKMTINSYGRLQEVYKDEWMKEFNKTRCFGINTLRNSTK
ncbi:hypothetical protein [Bacillus wiedmannii]|uniref:hypothetical protein n=1 Tax=Bacillus wiedmannii TaxID=1890302 RepID=UPI00211D189A|nr:hypothetical protein [Bacillus wiedmannii]